MTHPKTRFIAFTGSREVGLRINELAAKTQPGQIWIKRDGRWRWAARTRSSWTTKRDLDAAVEGVARFGVWISGAEVLGVLARDRRREKVYDKFLEKLKPSA